ncbi:redoxin domain-containing protein [Candidatus Uabimicrobium amorphum]|uniref:Thiol-disulfide isomerase n=1 Tax=Uabimicrobium amorphum TaxID=2596890 RepID=A0A5S9IIJ7_UABAM|nr:redoxin domain-containing protein [Candidatus Uabimicrobium amorphum]BBM82453.1 thiol-disulfide isomerase [Candidatus Uabimicrobium amorphum]
MNKTIIPLAVCIIIVYSTFYVKNTPQPTIKQLATVENFALLDHNGEYHELFEYKDKKALVLYIHGVGCPIVRHNLQDLHKLQKRYRDDVAFLMINGNIQDEIVDIREEATSFAISLPILKDYSQNVIELLQVKRTAEAIVINPQSWGIIYRGPVDNRVDYEKQKSLATRQFLHDAILATLVKRQPRVSKLDVKGCAITYYKEKQVSFNKEVVPILKKRCVICHRKGGAAPWSMNSHKKVHGWSEMIREAVLTRRMPPWPADPEVGSFKSSHQIFPEEKRKLLTWIKQGCALDGEDTLKSMTSVREEEEKPDLIVTIPTQKIPATGVVDYKYINVPTNLKKDMWVKKVKVIPGSKKAVHHALVMTIFPRRLRHLQPQWRNGSRGFFAIYVPGYNPQNFPENSGQFLPKGTTFQFQMHYTPYGRRTTDATQMHIYFHDKKPQKVLKMSSVINARFRIPPFAQNHRVQGRYTFRDNVTLYGLYPHMHYRGRQVKMEAIFPNGKRQTLLSVPKYEFNWQYSYYLQKPLNLPKGTTIRMYGVFDNSSRNKYDIDPSQTVGWGEQSWDEMFIGYLQYSKL